MITDYRWIIELFKEVDKTVSRPIEVFVIGGAVLLYQGLKTGTKDIDLVVRTKEESLALQKALTTAGFRPKIPGRDYVRMSLNQIFTREDFRIDLFEKEVCGKFALTKSMMERAKATQKLDKLTVRLCANEDIFLFKTMTEREGDLTDCISLARTEMNWKIMLNELKTQIERSKQDVWVTWVGERLDLLEEKGLRIPIMKEIDNLRKKYFDELEKNQK